MAGLFSLFMIDYSSFTFGLVTGALTGAFLVWHYRNRPLPFVQKSTDTMLFRKDYKMVTVVRTDLGMGKGKIGAQCAHAAIGCFIKTLKRNPDAIDYWQSAGGQAKVVLKCSSQSELLELSERAKSTKLITSLIADAGRTQIEPGSLTVLGIGPDESCRINEVTGHLKLL